MIRVDISLDNPGFNVTDAEVHHSGHQNHRDRQHHRGILLFVLVFWMSSFLFFINICFINVSIVNFLFRCDVFLCRGP